MISSYLSAQTFTKTVVDLLMNSILAFPWRKHLYIWKKYANKLSPLNKNQHEITLHLVEY
jgi:hypothetical protein